MHNKMTGNNLEKRSMKILSKFIKTPLPSNDSMTALSEEPALKEELSDQSEISFFGRRDVNDEITAIPASVDKLIDWEKALQENESWIKTVIAARVGEAAAVEEVFQEVSLALIRQRAPIQDPTKISPWLYRVAVTQSLLYRRSMGRKRKLIHRYTEQIPVSESDNRQQEPLEWLLQKERRAIVRKIMAQLPKNHQEILMLKYVHDWSYKEMAEKLGLSVSAVQSKLHRARGLLRDKILSAIPGESQGTDGVPPV